MWYVPLCKLTQILKMLPLLNFSNRTEDSLGATDKSYLQYLLLLVSCRNLVQELHGGNMMETDILYREQFHRFTTKLLLYSNFSLFLYFNLDLFRHLQDGESRDNSLVLLKAYQKIVDCKKYGPEVSVQYIKCLGVLAVVC